MYRYLALYWPKYNNVATTEAFLKDVDRAGLVAERFATLPEQRDHMFLNLLRCLHQSSTIQIIMAAVCSNAQRQHQTITTESRIEQIE